MPRIPLTEGAYQARGLIASAQRCVNLYPEVNPTNIDPPAPVTHYPTPGLTVLASPETPGPGRGLYRSSRDLLYAVVGTGVYLVSSNWTFTLLGDILDRPTPVSIKDNESFIFLVDGSPAGYTIDLGSNILALVGDRNYLGADRVDYLDTFFLFNNPNTPQFYSTLSNVTTFDENGLYFDNMTGEPTNCVAAVTLRGYVWVIGELATEVWYNAGDSNVFPFARMPGQVIQQGCLAKYSIVMCSGDDDTQSCILWLAQNPDGGGVVVRSQGYATLRVSTHAIEDEFRKYSTLTDAEAYCRQQDGHTYYVINFPIADKSWAYDLTTGQWHELVWTDNNGHEHRHRTSCAAFAYGKHVGLDWETGTLYALDFDNYTDNDQPIVRRRGFPNLVQDGKRVMYPRFIADMESGQSTGADGTNQENPPLVYLRYSDDHGYRWSNPIPLSLGAVGQSNLSLLASRLGMGRDRVFELFWSGPEFTALNGAFVQSIPMAS